MMVMREVRVVMDEDKTKGGMRLHTHTHTHTYTQRERERERETLEDEVGREVVGNDGER